MRRPRSHASLLIYNCMSSVRQDPSPSFPRFCPYLPRVANPLTFPHTMLNAEECNMKPSPTKPKELTLLVGQRDHHDQEPSVSQADHDLDTAPLILRDAYDAGRFELRSTQYGVLGRVLSVHDRGNISASDDPRIYVNTNAPFSAIVCGVQGAGKSHTVSVLLESMFISNVEEIGSLAKPLSGLVLHYGEAGASAHPCEAASIGKSTVPGVTPPKIKVFVSPSSLKRMTDLYAPLGKSITVLPLLFTENELDAAAILSMMAVGGADGAPLYIQIILSILRRLGSSFTFRAFTNELETHKKNFNPAQLAGLDQRMSIMSTFMTTKASQVTEQKDRFAAGQLTIVDLSDLFIDSASACSIFEIINRLFVRAEVGTGKVLLVDEAHKYLSSTKGFSGLTKSLLTLIREQRHHGLRVIISTQEPTVVPPVLLDLCSVAILHRFSSPAWWTHICGHVSADFSESDAFDKIVRLRVGAKFS
ncbi:hypothetical protein BD626DRAFT_480382 [Schizophyllum amplum]|uniref:Uncharacterized protein n=1 Tax=Schizophyllum amplum TaxID=97359 RepID=A0A550CT56_9AGAR|nr:hypothetical protein BD626DRAFT_480382 [Auriculariopsis ampla]